MKILDNQPLVSHREIALQFNVFSDSVVKGRKLGGRIGLSPPTPTADQSCRQHC
ncbi:hypothetical protein AXF42_Ash005383 [Apostasia shenzhenica]|uniref:Uncharacterized protein n=1 Tax=Apostasia shenzhenica TaxID=1088818 RepID=A0A2I0B6Q8_9ASPA|nr:hypothetical protein AXF42_Ash005383 [Apostasia shenzhenica]